MCSLPGHMGQVPVFAFSLSLVKSVGLRPRSVAMTTQRSRR